MTTIHTIARAYVCRFFTTTQKKGYSIKYFVACLFVSALNVMWLYIKQREKPVTVYAGFQCYLSSSGAMFAFANMPNLLAILIHSFKFVFIHKPRAISIIYTPYLKFTSVAVKRWSFSYRSIDRFLIGITPASSTLKSPQSGGFNV